MPRPPRLQRLTFSLLKAGLERDVVLRAPDDVAAFVVPAIGSDREALFVSATDPHAPWWESFLDPHVTGQLDGLFTASSSAVLLLEAGGRLFAVTFGQGRHLLQTDAVEQDFGLKVVLNTVRPDQLKSVDAKTIDETTMHTRRDVSRDSSFSAFGLDPTRDLLRAVTGTPPDESLARRLTGSDALALNTRAQVPDLPALAERLLEQYASQAYKDSGFDFIDYLRPERRAGRLRDLGERLVDALNQRQIDDVHLACPEPMDWLEVGGFRYTPDSDAELDADPRISAFLQLHGDDLTLEALKGEKLYAIRDADGQPLRVWPVYRCLVYETEVDGELYVLSTGEWFRVSLDFKDKVYAYAESLPETRLALPEADAGTDEDTYNRKASEVVGGVLLDKQLVFDGPDKTEICDVLTRDRVLVHVKQRGSSSTLSHLFAQGLNCAERLLQDPEFRTGAREAVARVDPAFAEVLPDGHPEPGDFEVAFVVLTRSKRDTPLTLPFFSVVSLRSAAMRLRALGYRVSVKAVREPA